MSIIITVIIVPTGCKKEEDKKVKFPTLITKTPLSITSNSAVVGGFISSDGGATIIERGVCYSSVNQNPTVSDSLYKDGAGTGNYQSNLSELDTETTYYLRAYAINSKGIGYGNTVSFTTEMEIIAPIAAFSATPDNGTRPLTVSFTDQSMNNPVSWQWDFGDGGYSTDQHPVHSYSYVRTYTVWLTVKNKAGSDIEIKNGLIKVTGATGTLTDIDGNVYPTIEIGTQTWMAKNLEVTHYRNGDVIQKVEGCEEWDHIGTGAYCWYDNSISWGSYYGALYNWYTVDDSRELCPAGWHTPSYAEWNILINYLGGQNIAGGRMKSTRKEPDAHPRWDIPNIGASNESGFSGLPGGSRSNFIGDFEGIDKYACFWSSTIDSISKEVRYCGLNHDNNSIFISRSYKSYGRSVRCLKD